MSFESITKRLLNLRWRLRPSEWRRWFGSAGERAAARELRRRHHVVLSRNFRCSCGEIDLVTSDGPTIVFVEVKTRSGELHQDAVDSVGPAKWARVERAARYYLLRHRVAEDRPLRFDLVTVVWSRTGRPTVTHYVDAHRVGRS